MKIREFEMKLPDKPSELVRVALADFEATEELPNHEIDMQKWGIIDDNDICHCCLAGSVMLQRFPDEYIWEASLHPHITNKYYDGCRMRLIKLFLY